MLITSTTVIVEYSGGGKKGERSVVGGADGALFITSTFMCVIFLPLANRGCGKWVGEYPWSFSRGRFR